GDLPADDDVLRALIGDLEEPTLLQGAGIDRTLERLVGRDVLPLDDRGVQETLDLLLLGLLEEFQGVPGDQADVLDRRRQAPDLGSDGADSGDGSELIAQASGQLAEDGGGYVLPEDHHPLDLIESIADQVPQAIRDAEQA